MKKIWELLQKFIIPLAEKPLLEQGEQWLEKFLEKSREKNPEVTDALVVNMYMLTTTIGRDLVADTAIDYDDHALEAAITEFKDYAALHGITLPEIDKP